MTGSSDPASLSGSREVTRDDPRQGGTAQMCCEIEGDKGVNAGKGGFRQR